MANKRHIEPFLWAMFGAGGTTIAFFFPAIILLVGILFPLEILSIDALSYERMSEFFLNNWLGKIAVIIALVPSYWACIHRIYHGSHDLGFHPAGWVKALCYGVAVVLSLVTCWAVLV